MHGVASAQPPSDQVFKVGVKTQIVTPPEPYDWRGARTHALVTTVWYPASADADEKPQRVGAPDRPPVFEAGMAAQAAPMAAAPPGRFPLLVMSHGTGGTALSLAWLGTALAARGYVVAAVNHPGNNALEDYTVQGFTLWWLRAQDLSRVSDALLADATFGPRIDAGRIGALGFSLGGYTVMEIAGAITSRTLLQQVCAGNQVPTMCKGPPEFPDLDVRAAELVQSDPTFLTALAGASQSYRDPRVRAVLAIAPALGPALTPPSLAAIAIPVALVAATDDAVVQADLNAKFIAANIPHAQLTLLPGGVGHYTFLDVCTPAGRDALAQLCVDAPGVDRAAVHDAVIALATGFFAAHLR